MLRMMGKSFAHLEHEHVLAQPQKVKGKLVLSIFWVLICLHNLSATGKAAESPRNAKVFFFFQFLLMLKFINKLAGVDSDFDRCISKAAPGRMGSFPR